MRNPLSKFLLLIVAFALSLNKAAAQIPTANSFSSQLNYNGQYRYGINMGWFAGWTAEQTANIAAGSSTVKGLGLRTYRIPLYDDFLSAWGLGAELNKFRHYASLGAGDHTVFVGNPSDAHREQYTYPGSPEQSRSFKGIHEPIWLDAGQTQVNPANTYAKYLYDVVQTYGQYVKFWEVMNEPDFTYSSAGWMDQWSSRNPTPEELPNLRAPIFSYIRMLRVTWEVVKRLNPDDYIAVGGLGYKGFLDAVMRNTDNPSDGSVTGTYPLRGGAYFDVISYHNYPMYDLTVGTRNSDRAASAMVAAGDMMQSVAAKYGYNGSQFPRKKNILTETGIPRFTQGGTWGSQDGQRNFAIKASILAQKANILQVYWYNLGDGTDGNNQHDRMGMFHHLGYTPPYNQNPTDQGKAFRTTTEMLYGKYYDAGRTAALGLPASIEGAAFRGNDGSYVYVLWAKTTGDINESASAVYSFPSSVIPSANVVRREWDFGYSNATTTVPKLAVQLTGSPSFFTDAGGVAGPSNQAPVARAGNDQAITLPATSANLSGSGTDADGIISAYAWAQVSGPTTAALSSPTQNYTTANNLMKGVYLFELKVTDNGGTEGRDTVQVTVNPAPGPASGRVEAESFSAMSGVQKETSYDAGGGQSVGYIDAGDWMEYDLSPTSTGTYTLNLRIATANSGGQIQIKKLDGTTLGTVSVPATGGWQTWQTISTTINLTAGNEAIRIHSGAGNWNINWFEFNHTGGSTTTPPPTTSSRVEAENYTGMNGVQKENTTDAGGGQNVGYVDGGDWMDYSINPAATGAHVISLRVATANSGGVIDIKKADGTILGSVPVPVTGGWQTWQTITTTVNLSAGNQTLRLFSGNGNWNINWMEIVAGGGGTTTTPPSTTSRVEAENYTSMSGVQKETTSDAGGGQNVGYIDNGDWMDYSINPATSGTFTVSVRVATPQTGGQIQLKKADGSIAGTVTLPNTGGWQTWQTATGTVTLSAGQQTLRLQSGNAVNFNINWFELAGGGGSTPTTPATNLKIEAEGYSAHSGTQTETTQDAGGGQNIGYIDAGDWVDYSVNATSAGAHAVNIRVAGPSGGQLEIRNSSGTVLARVNVPATGGWQTWQTVATSVTIPSGQQTLRIHAATGGYNINWWELRGGTGTVSASVTGEAEVTASGLKIYPNAITDRFQLGISNDRTGAVSVQVLDGAGIVKRQFSVKKSTKGAAQFYLALGTLTPGSYVIKVTMGDWTQLQTIEKK